MDDELATLQSVHGGIHDGTGNVYRAYSLQAVSGAESSLPLPPAPLPKGATAVIPIATMLGGLTPVFSSTDLIWSSEEEECRDHAIRVFQHGNFREAADSANLIGPHFQPRCLEYSRAGRPIRQDLHDFDLSNVYRLGRYWQGGSCPHCFWRNREGLLTYAGELLSGEPDVVQTLLFQIPPDTGAIMIAELEDEITTLNHLNLDGTVVCGEVILAKGQHLDIFARGASVMEVRGSYHVTHDVGRKPDPWMKNRMIGTFLADQALPDPALGYL
jgi:hypothetical protein